MVGWRRDELLRAGYPPELAEDLAQRYLNTPDYVDLHKAIELLQAGARPDIAYQILSKKSDWQRTRWDENCPSCKKRGEKILHEEFDDDNLYSCSACNNNFRAKEAAVDILDYVRIQKTAGPNPMNPSTDYERQLNYEPQSQMVTSPDEVDTLRKDYRCPNCKSDFMQKDPDGILRCGTCSFASAPHPLDNPDLSVHQNIDMENEQEEQSELPEDIDDLINHIKIQPTNKGRAGLQPVSPINPINQQASAEGINRMKWTTVSNLVSVDTFIGNKDGINFDVYKTLQEKGLTAKITYPTGEETKPPFGNPIQDMVLGLRAQRYAKLASVSEVPITVETDLKDLDEVLEIIHTGTAKKKVLNPAVKTKTEDPQNAKIIFDSHAPVTSAEEKEADRRRIRRSEEGGDGIKRTEEIIEGSGEHVSPASEATPEEPVQPEEENVEEEEREYAVASERKMLAIFSLADEMVEAGLNPNQKLAFIAEIEKETEEQLAARRATLELMKQANPKRSTPKVARLPRFSSFATESSNGQSELDDVDFDAIFLS